MFPPPLTDMPLYCLLSLSSTKLADLDEARSYNNADEVVITSNDSFCGGYNPFITKKAGAQIPKLRAQGVELELILTGDWG